jgi:hypothetical protein
MKGRSCSKQLAEVEAWVCRCAMMEKKSPLLSRKSRAVEKRYSITRESSSRNTIPKVAILKSRSLAMGLTLYTLGNENAAFRDGIKRYFHLKL